LQWHILTGEYPPQPGGVSDYTRLVAQGLTQRGDEVHVWAPANAPPSPSDPGVIVHRLPSWYGIFSLIHLHRTLRSQPKTSLVLVQYVPHMYGFKGMNLLFALWLWLWCPLRVWTMFHEVNYPFGKSLKENLLASVQWLMAKCMVRGSEKIFISILGWHDRLRDIAPPLRESIYLPVPSNVDTDVLPESVEKIRNTILPPHRKYLIGHFGTYGESISNRLTNILPRIAEDPDIFIVLLGRGSESYAAKLTQNDPHLGQQIAFRDDLTAQEVALHLSACHLLLQPYPDGASTRRGSLMAGLALGIPIVTNVGFLSEPFWNTTDAIERSIDDPIEMVATIRKLLANPNRREQLAIAAKSLYQNHFSIEHTIGCLRKETRLTH
jgi:glycosyltransferase involved in cell wall biosynthesis